jgi:catechol 2,3-dioxygenase-like lactoylglutathione lyase family enzyme
MYYAIHHVQLSCPPGSEDASRAFFVDVLAMSELIKPPRLAARGGCWFRGPGDAAIEFHLGVQSDFTPAVKAHPGVVWGDAEALRELARRLTDAGHAVTWDAELHDVPMHLNGLPDAPVHAQGMLRFYTADPHGNRLEFLAPRP